jgi:hypothetical protein
MFKAIEELIEIENGELRIERSEELPPIEIQTEYLNVLRTLT